MATDLIVAPLWRYFCGDYRSPLEGLGLGDVATLTGASGRSAISPTHRGPGLWRRFKAKRRARLMQAGFRKASGRAPDWNENSECVYCEQFVTAHQLAAFAFWLEYQDLIAAPKGPVGSEFTDSLYELQGKLSRQVLHPHIRACVQSGFFVPLEFPEPVVVGHFEAWGIRFPIRMASAPAALRALECLKAPLGLIEPFVWEAFRNNPWVQAMEGWDQLKRAALLAAQQRLPLIVDS